MLIGISAIIAAVAFVVLVYYLVDTLKSLKQSLDEMRSTVNDVKNEISTIAAEVKDVVHQTNQMTLNVRTKLNALDALFDTVNDIGQVAREFTLAVKQTAVSAIQSFKRKQTEKQIAERQAAAAGPASAGANVSGKTKAALNGLSLAIRLLERYAVSSAKPRRAGASE